MDIKAVCFDLDGVYFTPESFKRFKNVVAKDADKPISDYVFHESKEILQFKKGEISENEYWDFVRLQLEITLSNEEIFKIMRDSYETNPQVVEIVHRVRKNGFKTCVCSNNYVTRIRELNNKFKFLDDFDTQIFAYDVGVLKPDKKIFEALINQSKVKPSEIIYSDDSPDKLKGATELGIHTFVYEDIKSFINKLKSFGVL